MEIFRLAGIQENSDWLLPLVVTAFLFVWFLRRYKIDAVELKTWHRVLLLSLRSAALLGLLVYYLHPQWENLVAHSRVAVLIDSSASMARRDLMPPERPDDTHTKSPDADSLFSIMPSEGVGPSRLEALVDWMGRSHLIETLSEKHEVSLYEFNETVQAVPPGMENMLNAEGGETRVGDSLAEILKRERGRPLAGIVLLSDGGQNAGSEIETTLETAHEQRIPVFPVGVGAVAQPLNFCVGNMDIPDRVFPGDPFLVRVPIERQGGEVEPQRHNEVTIKVELWLATDAGEAGRTKLGEKEMRFSSDSPEVVAKQAEFEVLLEKPGKHRVTAQIIVPETGTETDAAAPDLPDDNSRTVVVEAVDRKDRILMFASAPTRDYQFLGSLIHRDNSMSVDVFLPWAKPGISQNADKILERFPSTRAEMAEYDIVIAFDPDWRQLTSEQIDVLEFWVARQGGGLWIFAGAIHQADGVAGWVADRSLEKIRSLYPVEFHGRQSAFEHRYRSDDKPWPLKLSRAGGEAEFLKPDGSASETGAFWNKFPGFYGFFAVRGIKPTATLLASSGSPETLGREATGTLIAEQFYGSGRVLYFGSSELWRLRRTDEKAFEQIAVRILRHVAQGRLHRESDRASLATDKQQYALGGSARLRVTAADERLDPVTQPTLPVDVVSPSGMLRTVNVTLDPNLPGTYQGYVPMNEEGEWSIRFTAPGTDQALSRVVSVRMNDLERERPNRNEPLLREIAAKTGGVYFASPMAAAPAVKSSGVFGDLDLFAATSGNDKSQQTLAELLTVRSQRAVPDTAAEEKMLRVLLIVVCSCLMLEWTLRRLCKLA